MAFQATKREWGELYSFFRLLADGYVCAGTEDGTPDENKRLRIAFVQRQEHDGTRRYYIDGERVMVVYNCDPAAGTPDKSGGTAFPREDFAAVADLLLDLLRNGAGEEELASPDGVEEFLDAVRIYDLEAKTDDRTDFHLAFWDDEAPLVGFRAYSHPGGLIPLLDGGRTANLKFEQTGVRFPNPTVNKINMLESANEVTDRMLMIERMGGVLKYSDVADKIFRSNLLMIDLHFPRMMAEMVRTMHYEGLTRVTDLTERIKEINPLKIKDELVTKHHFYEYKVKQFLMALALGMRPAKLFNGTDSAVEGFIYTNAAGEVVCYHKGARQVFENFLYRHTRLEKGNLDKDKYGFLERENGLYYFKLNLKIGFVKRAK